MHIVSVVLSFMVPVLGRVEEEQFAEWVKKLPEDTLHRILAFHIIPVDISAEAHRTFTSLTNYTAQNSVRVRR